MKYKCTNQLDSAFINNEKRGYSVAALITRMILEINSEAIVTLFSVKLAWALKQRSVFQ